MSNQIFEGVYYVGIPFIGLIAWLIKLDAKTSHNSATIDHLDKQLKEHMAKFDLIHTELMDRLTDIREDISEIKGFLKK